MKDNLFDENEFEEINKFLQDKEEIEDFVKLLKPNKKLKKALWNAFGRQVIGGLLFKNKEIYEFLSNPPEHIDANEYDFILDNLFNEMAKILNEANNENNFDFMNQIILSALEDKDK